jgi:hypothetical protein
MAVILSRRRKKIGVDNFVLMRVSLVIVIMTRMQVQGWQEKRGRQENWQKR